MVHAHRLLVLILSTLAFTACQSSQKKLATSGELPVDLVSGVRQLTFVGSRSGEGYFSADGRQMIFQSEREEGNPFYQIYLMDLDTGRSERLSTGQGKTTCAWLHPKKSQALFASTHKDPKWKEKAQLEKSTREKGERPKYSWSYDDQYDLYQFDLKTRQSRVISPALGYDAEGSYSPDGEWIAFASNRHAYVDASLSEAERKRLENDPSFFMEIYIMRADGRDLRRLTSVPGYDGGPFFSADGRKITWRRFTPDGKTAEVWTMDVDGGTQRQITRLGAMSWAPYFHPSGDYIIFGTNLHGHDNFELYMVDSAGLKNPVRVTDRPGFDSLPVFTPDGTQLSWTSRNQKGESQILLGQWDDARARRLLGLPIVPVPGPKRGSPELDLAELKSWVEYLASAQMAGRAPGGEAEKKYTQHISSIWQSFALSPVGGDSFVQEFQYPSGVELGKKNELRLTMGEAKTIELQKDWAPVSFGSSAQVQDKEIVFVGYGISAPASEKIPAFDSYADADVNGKWVIVLPDLPNDLDLPKRYHLNLYAKAQHKVLVARQKGAAGVIFVKAEPGAAQLRYQGAAGETSLPVIEVSQAWANELLASSGMNLKAWESQLSQGQSRVWPVTGARLSAHIELTTKRATARNVVAQLIVPGAKGTIVIGAHGDHLGHGESGNSLAKTNERGQIHYGADDNASGVAAVMELSHRISNGVRAGELRSRYNFIFAVWSAEELGVLGANHFVAQYKGSPIKAYLNLDMVGRLREQLIIQGVGSAKEWTRILESVLAPHGLPVALQNDPYLPTDALSFYMKEVPVLSFFTGAHSEYHTPRDTPDLINYSGLMKVTQVVADVAKTLAEAPSTPKYTKVQGNSQTMGGRGFRLYLGTIPDYSQEGVRGVKITGTTKASPAEVAGLKTGDIIVELGGVKIENIQDYVYCLQAMKANQKTNVTVLREGQRVQLEITPALKGGG